MYKRQVHVQDSVDWASDQFMISVFWPPTKDYVTDEHYKAMADAGIDYVNNVTGNDLNDKETNLKMAELAFKYGMQVSVADHRFGGNLTLSLIHIWDLLASFRVWYSASEPVRS